jgi:hypothetical protein
MRAKAATVSRRQMPASVATISALGELPAVAEASDDPVFAAIERHRQAKLALLTARGDAVEQLLEAKYDALLAWLQTPPTTLAGVIATLEHATVKHDDGFYEYTHLGESAQYSGDVRKAGEEFPAMLALALRQIGS